MIPKKIHYCWFGGKELPQSARRYMESWKKHCPDWEIIRWDESNFDIQKYPFAEYCLKNQEWAFLSDIVRLAVVYEYGGVYLDTDVEVLRPLDPLCDHEAFYGFQLPEQLNTGHGFGAEAGHRTLKAMLDAYLSLEPDACGVYPLIPCPVLNTSPLVELGLKLDGSCQNISGARIYSLEYFNPYEYTTGRMRKTSDSYCIHWYSQSWISPWGKLRCILTRPFHRVFGVECFSWLKRNRTDGDFTE